MGGPALASAKEGKGFRRARSYLVFVCLWGGGRFWSHSHTHTHTHRYTYIDAHKKAERLAKWLLFVANLTTDYSLGSVVVI